jgi:adenosylcobinamide-phosphate synthase
MGQCASYLEERTRVIFSHPKLAGLVTTILMIVGTYFVCWALLWGVGKVSLNLEFIVETLMIYTALSIRCLYDESKRVLVQLRLDNLKLARKYLSRIVGRDTEKLNQQEVAKATVETIAENTVDGIIAPLFFACIGGGALALTYKCINTMDSMFGYKNERYFDFGFYPAKLDDLVNWFPARIGGIIIATMSVFCGLRAKDSFATLVRDGQNHASPNAGIPEAAVAGALGIQLGGVNYYQGERVEKPCIGVAFRESSTEDIEKTHQLMFASALAALIIFLTLRECIVQFI